MAKAGSDNNDPSKMFSADVIAAVLAAGGITSLTMKQYEMMSAVDGNRTANSFQHAFRSIIAKSKEFKARVDDGEVFEPVRPVNKRGATGSASASPATPRKRKTAGTEDNGTPAKKRSPPNKKAAAAESSTNDLDGADELPSDMDDFIKQEQEWTSNDFI